MRPESVELLKRLVETPSPSGFEQPVQRIVREELAKFVVDRGTPFAIITIDNMKQGIPLDPEDEVEVVDDGI